MNLYAYSSSVISALLLSFLFFSVHTVVLVSPDKVFTIHFSVWTNCIVYKVLIPKAQKRHKTKKRQPSDKCGELFYNGFCPN